MSLRPNPVLIHLEPWEYEHACNVGIRRFTANWGKHDAPHYDSARMEDNRTAQVASAICELAVAKHTNRYWSGHVWHASEHHKYRNAPDVGHNIEVKRVRTGTTVAVRKRQLGQNLILFAARPEPPEFRVVEIGGWEWMDEAWANGRPSDYSPDDTRVFDIEKMKL